MSRVLQIAVICALMFAARASPHKDCGSVESIVEDVQLSGCPDSSQICTITKGSNASLSIKFKTNTAITGVNVVIHGIVAGVPVPYPAPQPDGCKDSGLSCPLASNTEYQYQFGLLVQQSYPSLRLTIKYELVDTVTSKDIVCVIIPVQITDPARRGKKQPLMA